jgi:hypothetical protein
MGGVRALSLAPDRVGGRHYRDGESKERRPLERSLLRPEKIQVSILMPNGTSNILSAINTSTTATECGRYWNFWMAAASKK